MGAASLPRRALVSRSRSGDSDASGPRSRTAPRRGDLGVMVGPGRDCREQRNAVEASAGARVAHARADAVPPLGSRLLIRRSALEESGCASSRSRAPRRRRSLYSAARQRRRSADESPVAFRRARAPTFGALGEHTLALRDERDDPRRHWRGPTAPVDVAHRRTAIARTRSAIVLARAPTFVDPARRGRVGERSKPRASPERRPPRRRSSRRTSTVRPGRPRRCGLGAAAPRG